MRPEAPEKLMALEGPAEGSLEGKQLVNKHGFPYRTLLGELIHAYMICRVHIGFVVCFLARFSTCPHDKHYKAMKHVCKYPQKTKEWGITFCRAQPLDGLPNAPLVNVAEDSTILDFPRVDWDDLVGTLDAAHAADSKKRWSVRGLTIFHCGAAITWKSRLQDITA